MIPRFAALWHAVEDLLTEDGPPASGRALVGDFRAGGAAAADDDEEEDFNSAPPTIPSSPSSPGSLYLLNEPVH